MLRCDADDLNEPGTDSADYLEQECSEPRQQIVAAGENPNICPRIEIVFNRQQEEVFLPAPTAKLGAVGALFPANAIQQFPIGGMERNEVTSAAMIWPENELFRRQLRESALDVAGPKFRTIPPDGDDLVIAKLRYRFDGILEPRREVASRLSMDAGPGCRRIGGGSEKVKIDFR